MYNGYKMKDAPKVPVTIRFEAEVHAQLVKMARSEERPLNAQVNLLLKRALLIAK